jgi:hypothetical protein
MFIISQLTADLTSASEAAAAVKVEAPAEGDAVSGARSSSVFSRMTPNNVCASFMHCFSRACKVKSNLQ